MQHMQLAYTCASCFAGIATRLFGGNWSAARPPWPGMTHKRLLTCEDARMQVACNLHTRALLSGTCGAWKSPPTSPAVSDKLSQGGWASTSQMPRQRPGTTYAHEPVAGLSWPSRLE